MPQDLFYTSLRRDIKRFAMPVHSGMERFLPNDGIDAIEKRQIGRPGLLFVLDLASRKKRIRDWTEVLEKYP